MDVSVTVNKLKSRFSNILHNKIMFENYGIRCFDKPENFDILYLEILLLEGIGFFCFEEKQLELAAQRDYKGIYNKWTIYISSLPTIKINEHSDTTIIETDDWDALNW